MIQRIQSIFLLLASGAVGSLFAPLMALGKVIHGTTDDASSPLADGVFTITDNAVLIGLTAAAAVGLGVAIFLFRNRKWQIRLSQIGNVLSGGLLAYGYFLFQKAAATLKMVDIDANHAASEVGYGFGVVAPILAIILSLIAIRFIKKDEAIVRSADRLR